MQLSTRLGMFFGVAIIFTILSQYPWLNPIKIENPKNEDEAINYRGIQYSDFLVCKEPNRTWTESMPLNYLGLSLTSPNREILTLCPGDSFGDFNNTYLVMKNCDLEMYHKGKLVWSAMRWGFGGFGGRYGLKSQEDCACFLGQDGNVNLFYGIIHRRGTWTEQKDMFDPWTSETNFRPLKTELRVQDQQFQILQTFKDGSQRLFYLSETSPKIREYLGEPKKIGGSGFVKKHTDNDTTILKKNEYLGDLDGLHLILQTNCELHLINQNRTIWYFQQSWTHEVDCSLIIQDKKWISLSKRFLQDERPDILSLMILHPFKALESEFTLKDNQLIITQTLEDGSKMIFEGQPGNEIGLKLRKEPRKIAKDHVTITKEQTPFIIQRMDYIGDLNGLHLILQDDCTWMLVNGQERLWQLNENSHSPCMDCFIELFTKESSSFEFVYSNRHRSLGHPGFGVFMTSGEITLKNNHAIVTLYYEKYNTTNEYFAGINTQGGWSQRISEHSLVLKAQDHNDFNFRDLSYIGDLDGVYLMMNDCNWVLYNQSQILWESGKEWKPEYDQRPEALLCSMDFKSDGTLATPYRQVYEYDLDQLCPIYEYGYLWSTNNITKNSNPSQELLTSELSVQNDWLWLTNTYNDGTVEKFMALEGTNNFIAV